MEFGLTAHVVKAQAMKENIFIMFQKQQEANDENNKIHSSS